VSEAPYCGAVTTQVIILDGGSSSGKSGIVRCLQAVLPDPWPADGGVSVAASFRALEEAWINGIVAMARAGARVIVDDVFLGGTASQQRWLECARAIAARVS